MPDFDDELLDLARAATGPGLTEAQRARWRELTIQLLGRIREQHPEIPERRKSLRAPLSLEVDILAPEELASVVTSNVSAGGIRFPCADEVPAGAILDMSIDVPERNVPLLCKGTVVYSGNGQLGVAFIDLFQNDRELLEGLAVKALLSARPT